MASILQIGKSWRAQVRKPGRKSISKTFTSKAAAQAWANRVERDADKGLDSSSITVAELIAHYRKMREESGRPVDDTANEWYMLNGIEQGLGKYRLSQLDTKRIVAFCQDRKKAGAGPYTVNMDVSKLGTVLRHAGSFLGLALPDIVGVARPTLHHLRLIGGGKRRNRRPTSDELEAIFAWLAQQTGNVCSRMPDIIRLAIIVGMRRGEIFRVRWVDVDERRKLVCIRDRKHPRQKIGNDQWIPLLGEAWEILLRQPKDDERIFPFEGGTVSRYFTRACRELSIPDLHFHDMRHEAHSALVEAGWGPLEIKAVTGNTPKQQGTYVNLDAERLHAKVVPNCKVK